MNTQEDLIARFVYLAKQKHIWQNERKHNKSKLMGLYAHKGMLTNSIVSCENHIKKTINLCCDAEGEQKGLKSNMTKESIEKAIALIKDKGLPV